MSESGTGEAARPWLREIGSIVLGVLIALAIGEVADGLRHRVNARATLAVIRTDLGRNGVSLEERMMKGRCYLRRLDELRAELAAARRTGRLRPIGAIGQPNIRPFYQPGWNTLLGSGELNYLPRRQIDGITSYFSMVETYDEMQREEQSAWARLRVLENRTGPVEGDLMAELETTIEETRNRSEILNVTARQMWIFQHYLGVATDRSFFDNGTTAAMARASVVCQPLQVAAS
ncbi:hypothetical protein [Sphingomonas sp. Leaf4]|uniref:hypothetical protein n=1 Tax=Sphingomonas sp. Leaf4 TaxID=2876553 RepID=UPI001E5BA2C9|nr:hypothetical protein [Sphingomonas sp. Leaf4]